MMKKILSKAKELGSDKIVKEGVDAGVDIVKGGISSIINAILMKVVMVVVVILGLFIGSMFIVNSFSSDEHQGTLSEVQQKK